MRCSTRTGRCSRARREHPAGRAVTPPPIPPPDDSVEVTTLAQWRTWLKANHTRRASIWLVTYKRGASKPQVSYDDAVSEALCWGWIDSLPRKLDAERTMLRFSPRSKNTGWSALNKQRAERMIAAKRMQPAGLAKVEAAKADGSWSRLDDGEAERSAKEKRPAWWRS